jgi:lysophospholipase L1-like esterase
MIKAIYDLDMTPRRSLPIIINVSQNDDLGRTLVFNLFSSTGTWTAPDSATATLEGGKPDGKFFSFNCTYSKGTVTAIIQQQMTAVSGKVVCKVKIQSGNKVIESAPIYMMVDAAGIPDGADMSKSDVNDAVAAATKKIVEQVAGSIPEDYSALNKSVDELKQDLGDTSNELYKKEEREIAVDSSDYNLLENKVAYIDTNNEVMTYENANAYVMHKNVISGEKYRILSQTHGSVNTLLYAICDSNGKVINSAKMGVPINTYITTEITIPDNGVEMYLNEFPTQTYPLVVNKIETINISKINGKETVNCWGDSLIRGVGVGDSYSKAFPYVLHGLLDGRKVINCGVGGENTINIASRQGGLPNIVKPFTIPANASKVEIELTNIYGDSTGILLQGGSALDPTTGKYVMTAQINPCSINGVEGTLTYENEKYYFSRSENGESVIVSRPTPLITYAMKSMRDNINIIWIGTNGGFTTSAELIECIEAMIDYMSPINKKYIVIGVHHLVSTVTETFETIEKNMSIHFGRHFINQRKYMLEYGLSDARITPTAEDITAISQGKIPPSLLYDDVHYNDKGYNIIATLASERGKELGYWQLAKLGYS